MQALSVALLPAAFAVALGTPGCVDCSLLCASNDTFAEGSCRCDARFGRCACSHEGAALRVGGRCIRASLPLVASGCGQGELSVRALLVIGTLPSPELQQEHVDAGVLPDALAAILQSSTAGALDLDPSAVVLVQPALSRGLLPDQSMEFGGDAAAGILLPDVSFGICAPADAHWPGGASFERRFRQSAQEFHALRVSSMRFAELTPIHGGAEDASPPASWSAAAGGVVDPAASVDGENGLGGPEPWPWVVGASMLAAVALVAMVIKLVRVRMRRARFSQAKPRGFSEFSPAPRSTGEPGEQVVGASLARATSHFQPSTEDGRRLAAEAGLQPDECLAVVEGELVEAMARGEGWLYGRSPGSGRFGYLPEAFISWTTPSPVQTPADDESRQPQQQSA